MYQSHMKMHNIHMKSFYEQIKLGRKTIDGRFAIPSGIRCADPKAIERYFSIESVGIITTKSISIEPREGYKEPVYVKYGENSYINAVGLSNPGAHVFKEGLSQIRIPENKFLLVSLCGGDVKEFYDAAKELYEYADGFELNMSCPHAKGYGLQVGNDSELVGAITKKIAESFDIPVFVKLSAAIPNVAHVAKIAVENGAAGITAVNTLGPSIEYISEMPVLSNREGGMSGEAIRPMGLKAVMDIRKAIGNNPIIIGMGGIFNKKDVDSYNMAGADFFGIGSALTNLNTEEAVEYLNTMRWDLIRQRPEETYTLKPVHNMDYNKCTIEEREKLTDNLYRIRLSKWKGYEDCADTAGKFYFIMIAEIGEKPFALYSHAGRDFIVRRVGPFTEELTKLKAGDVVYIRGPYGRGMEPYQNVSINLVGGGTGISPLFEIGRKYWPDNKVRFFLGGKSQPDIFDLERFEAYGEVNIATEDGSVGTKGFVSETLKAYDFPEDETQVFINVGPRPMIEAVYEIEKDKAEEDNIWVSIEYHTSCGVGICGKCASEQGAISCVDGPFLRVKDSLKVKTCQCKKID